MKIIFCGDVVGRSGRDAVLTHLPVLKKQHGVHFTIVNVDNASGGFGCTPQAAKDFLSAGVDVLTAGDHVWDQKELPPMLAQEKRLLRPANFPDSAPGRGHGIFEAQDGRKVLVLHLLGQVFLKYHAACPFAEADKILSGTKLGANGIAAAIVDFHAEATSEKTAMGVHLDGRVSLVVGSHTHIPTADARVLKGGTAYMTDAGMCGDYNSVIGFEPKAPLHRFLSKIPKARMEPAQGEGTLCGLLLETDDATGKAASITPLRIGGALC